MKKAQAYFTALIALALTGGVLAFKATNMDANVYCTVEEGECKLVMYKREFVAGAETTDTPCAFANHYYTNSACQSNPTFGTVYKVSSD